MRIIGSVYTFAVGIFTLIPDFFNTPGQLLSYQIADDLVFPIRDFIEVIFFSYLFHYQSKRKGLMRKITEKFKASLIEKINKENEERNTLQSKNTFISDD